MHVPPHDGLNEITNWKGIIPQWRHNGGEFENEQGNWSDFHGNGGKRTKRTSEEEKKKKNQATSALSWRFVALQSHSFFFDWT